MVTIVYDSLFGYIGQSAIDFENSDTGSDHDRHLTRPVETPVQVMLLKHVQRHVQNFKEIALSSTRVDTLKSIVSFQNVPKKSRISFNNSFNSTRNSNKPTNITL